MSTTIVSKKVSLDCQGLAIEHEDNSFGINNFIYQVLSYGQKWDVILKCKIPCVLSKCMQFDYYIAKNDMKMAMESISIAKELYDTCPNARAKMYYDAYLLWSKGMFLASYDSFKLICMSYPLDLFALKRAQLMAFIAGRPDLQLEIAELPTVKEALYEKSFYSGCLAFALEQNGQLELAEAEGRRGCIDTEAFVDVWAHHAVAHATYAQGKIKEGLEVMNIYSKYWTECMSFMYTHNWFHVGLFYMDVCDFNQALNVFDEHIWLKYDEKDKVLLKEHTDFYRNDKYDAQDHISAMLLLWFNETRQKVLKIDYNVDEYTKRWKNIMNYVEMPTAHWDILYDILILYGLCRINQKIKAYKQLEEMKHSYEECPEEKRKNELISICSPLADGIVSYTYASPNKALDYFTSALGESCHSIPTVVGGSAEQRSILYDYYIEILHACDENDILRDILDHDIHTRGNIPIRSRLLSTIPLEL